MLAHKDNSSFPKFSGLDEAAGFVDSDFKIFGKPSSRPYRRMGVVLTYGTSSTEKLVERAKKVASKIKVN